MLGMFVVLNAAKYPEYFQELEGMAAGSGVSMQEVKTSHCANCLRYEMNHCKRPFMAKHRYDLSTHQKGEDRQLM